MQQKRPSQSRHGTPFSSAIQASRPWRSELMANPNDPVAAPLPEPPRLLRPARSLIGWMAAEQGERVQVGNRQDVQATPEQVERARAAREAVAARVAGVDQQNLLAPVPAVLDEYLAAFRAHAAFAPFAAEGW